MPHAKSGAVETIQGETEKQFFFQESQTKAAFVFPKGLGTAFRLAQIVITVLPEGSRWFLAAAVVLYAAEVI